MRTLFVLLCLWSVCMLASGQTPLVDISFDKAGPVNSGTFENLMTSYDASYTSSRFDPIKNNYILCFYHHNTFLILYVLQK